MVRQNNIVNNFSKLNVLFLFLFRGSLLQTIFQREMLQESIKIECSRKRMKFICYRIKPNAPVRSRLLKVQMQ